MEVEVMKIINQRNRVSSVIKQRWTRRNLKYSIKQIEELGLGGG